MDQSDLSTGTVALADADWTDAAFVVLRALRGEGLAEFDELARRVAPEVLKDLGASEHGQAWSRVPRHLVPDDYRLVTLHATSRMYRLDGAASHLDGDMFETIVGCLEAGDATWAEQAARTWLTLVLHTGEASSVWPQARGLLDRYTAVVLDHPGLLGKLATVASTCGDPVAGELWDRVLSHPTLGDNASMRWDAELDWARCHLLHAGGEPARAMKVIARARRGFADLGTPSSHVRWTDATLELACGLTWIGRPEEALQLIEESLRNVEPGGEIEHWMRVAAAYPAATLGDDLAIRDAEAAIELATTDTSTMQLRALYPARVIVAMRHHDRVELRRIVHEAIALESGGPLDFEARLNWRIHALEAAIVIGDHELAQQVLDEVDAEFERAGFDMPVPRIRRDRAADMLDGGPISAGADRRTDEALRRGMTLPSLEPADWATSDARSAEHALTLRLLGPFDVCVDGEPIPERAWSGRRQARVLLALLLLHGNRLPVDTVADLLWSDVDGRTARARISPLCASIRSILAAAGASNPERELVTRGGTITLRLHDGDRTDLDDLRDAAARVRREPARSRDLARSVLERTTAEPVNDLGTDRAAAELRVAIRQEVAKLVPALASAWEGRPAPRSVVDAVRRIVEADPTDANACASLMRLLRDRDDAPGASDAYHRLRRALRDELGLDPPTSITQLHTAVISA